MILDGLVEAENITNVEPLKVAVLGEPGDGKSWLITTARQPILVYDFDDRKQSIAGRPGVSIKTLIDIDDNIPVAWGKLESDIGTLEYYKGKPEFNFKSIALDSMTFLHKYAQNQMMKDAAETKRGKQIGTSKYIIPQGWDAINYVQRMLQGILRRLFALDVDIYCTFHIRREKAPDSTEKNPKFTGKYTVDPQNIKMLLPMFNERWMMKDGYKIQVHQDDEFNAITALKGLADLEDANIEAMLLKHAASTAKK